MYICMYVYVYIHTHIHIKDAWAWKSEPGLAGTRWPFYDVYMVCTICVCTYMYVYI